MTPDRDPVGLDYELEMTKLRAKRLLVRGFVLCVSLGLIFGTLLALLEGQ